MGDQNFLNIEQIIPLRDVEDFMIGIADKSMNEVEGIVEENNRFRIRREFWSKIIKEIDNKTKLFQNISPGNHNWIGAGSGVRGVSFNFVVSRTYGRAEIYIDRGTSDTNTFIFNELIAQKTMIEEAFGGPLTWEPLEGKRACRIKCETTGNIFEQDQWPQLISFMTEAMAKLERSFRLPLIELNQKLRNRKEPEDFEYCLDCFANADYDDDSPDEQEGSDDYESLCQRAEEIWKESRFKVLILYRWDEAEKDWVAARHWGVSDEADAADSVQTAA